MAGGRVRPAGEPGRAGAEGARGGKRQTVQAPERGLDNQALRCLTHNNDELMATYGNCDLFRLVSYDAGARSEDNARAVRQHGLHCLLGLKAGQPTLLAEAEAWLGSLTSEQAMAQTEDALGGGRLCVRRLYATEELAGFGGWEHLRVVLRVESETLDAQGRRLAHENRYFLGWVAPV